MFDQYIIEGPVTEDEERIREIFRFLQKKFGLFNNTFSTGVKDTIVCMSEAPYSGFGLGSRFVAGKIVVELNPRFGRSEKFNAVSQQLERELKEIWHCRLSLPGQSPYISEMVRIPISAEAKHHMQEFLRAKGFDQPGTD